MTDQIIKLLSQLAFAEATKSNISDFTDDATSIMHVALNRVKDKKYPNTLEEVLSQMNEEGVKQFTGYKGPEWNKTEKGTFTSEEKQYWDTANEMAKAVTSGAYQDPTNGALLYYNPELADPTWGKMRTPDTVKQWENFYPEAYKTTGHEFLKRELRRK